MSVRSEKIGSIHTLSSELLEALDMSGPSLKSNPIGAARADSKSIVKGHASKIDKVIASKLTSKP